MNYIISHVYLDFLWLKKKMKFCIPCCLFDYYIYKLATGTTVSFSRDIYKSKGIGYSFKLCTVDCFIHVCYTYVFTMIRIKRFNKDVLNKIL